MDVFEKIAQQQKSLKENSAPWVVGEQLKEICRDPHCAELVSADLDNPDMSLINCEKKIKEYADKHRTANFAYVAPKVADGIVRKFYGLADTEENFELKNAESGIVNLEDYM